MDRKGSAVWQGSIREGKGTVSTESGALKEAPYSFTSRFETGPGTNPEELLGAAHAGCFSMAFSGQLAAEKLTAGKRIATTATVTIEKVEEWLRNHARSSRDGSEDIAGRSGSADVRNVSRQQPEAIGCPVSKLFKADITLDAKLVA